MMTLTGLSGEYVTVDQNGAKMHGNIDFFIVTFEWKNWQF